MTRIDWEIGIYNEDIEQVLKWYTNNFGKENHPSKKDEETYHKFKWMLEDMKRSDKEDADS